MGQRGGGEVCGSDGGGGVRRGLSLIRYWHVLSVEPHRTRTCTIDLIAGGIGRGRHTNTELCARYNRE